ncbi:MAG: hypothetical protein MUF54_04490 [Polyangiaceae bacterium]|jgi:hypothetical protein|nr:hypothetical protein [Polyangiaceae bacterium]
MKNTAQPYACPAEPKLHHTVDDHQAQHLERRSGRRPEYLLDHGARWLRHRQRALAFATHPTGHLGHNYFAILVEEGSDGQGRDATPTVRIIEARV